MIDADEAAARHFAGLVRRFDEVPSPSSPEELRPWWQLVSELLGAHVRLRGVGQPQLPGPLIAALANIAGHLAVGVIPVPVGDVATRGRAAAGPDELSDRAWAVAYRLAAQPEGFDHRGEALRVSDARPVQTLSNWFGVSARTVQDWVASRPDLSGLGPLTSEILVNQAKLAGERVRAAGRGRAAIAERGRRSAGK